MSVTAFPTLPSTWAPSAQCVASTAFYYVIERTYTASGTNPGGIIYSLMYGIPTPKELGTIRDATPSGSCVPPSFTTDVPYITDSDTCPSGYSFACASATSHSGVPASILTCCPSGAFNFACGDGDYGCTTLGSTGQTWIGIRTDLVQSTARPDTFTVGGGNYLFAWGIKLLSTSATSTSIATSATLTSTPSSGTESQIEDTNTISVNSATTTQSPLSTSTAASSGLGSAARIGVGVGVGIAGAMILAALGWFFLYRRRQRRSPPPAPESQGSYNHHPERASSSYYSHHPERATPSYYNGPRTSHAPGDAPEQSKPPSPYFHPSELSEYNLHPYELPETTQPRPQELPVHKTDHAA